jgi:hypothetical protein
MDGTKINIHAIAFCNRLDFYINLIVRQIAITVPFLRGIHTRLCFIRMHRRRVHNVAGVYILLK